LEIGRVPFGCALCFLQQKYYLIAFNVWMSILQKADKANGRRRLDMILNRKWKRDNNQQGWNAQGKELPPLRQSQIAEQNG
jgi:hypothetical protein